MAAPEEPKRRNSARTKARILAAANASFAEQGYAKTSLRDIAFAADVAPSLLIRYFGSKADLFEAALIDTIAANSVFTSEKQAFGERMARLMLEQANTRITTMLVLALADPESKEVVERVSRTRILEPLAAWVGGPDGFERALNLFSLMTGFVVLAQSLRSDAIPQASLTWLADSLQAIVDA